MLPPSSHPPDQILIDFGYGKLGDGLIDAVNRHVESCARCQQKVAELGSDSFLGRLRHAHAAPAVSAPAPAALAKAVAPLPAELVDHPDYQVVRELGRGGMGVVYLAHNRLLGRDEVLKVVSRHMVGRAGVPDRFRGEIRAAARLHHPNIVAAYTAFHAGESLVFAMEYVDGMDLARLVQLKGPLPVAHACYFAHQAALGLQHAYEQGMVHRDIKPGNLMLARPGGRAVVKVLDFGLAKATRETPVERGLTSEGQMLGTPDFIAPEQIRDAQSADIRADIYSLGCTLYYLLSGAPPFRAETLYELLQAHFSMAAGPLNLLRPEVPVELAALIGRMMAKEPGRRFQTPGEVAKALAPFFRSARPAGAGAELSAAAPRPQAERWASLPDIRDADRPAPPPAEPIALLPTPEPEPLGPTRRPPRRWRLAASAAGAVALLGVIIIVVNIDRKESAQPAGAAAAPRAVANARALSKVKLHPVHDEQDTGPRGRPPWLDPLTGREPVPSAEQATTAEQVLRAEIERRTEGRSDLAHDLIAQAQKPAAPADERFVRLSLARRFAAEDGDFALALTACDELARWYDVDVVALKAKLLDTHARFAADTPKHDALACAALAAGFEALALDDFRYVGTLVRLARTAARNAGVAALSDEADFLKEELGRAQAAYPAVAPHVEVLRGPRDDAAANAAVGRYLCLAKGDFLRGLPLLERGNDRALRAAAEAEAQTSDGKPDRATQLAAGDQWWELGESGDLPQDRCRLRARHWYLRALALDDPPADSATVARVRQRLQQIPARDFRVRVRGRHVDIHTLRIDDASVRSLHNYGGWPTVSFNHLTWDTLKVPLQPNHGATRFLPDDVDYTTVSVENYRRTGGQWANYGRGYPFAREDHVDLQFKHWPSGAFDVELTLVFGNSFAGKDLAIEPEWNARFFTWTQGAGKGNPDYWDQVFQGEPIATATIRRFHFDDNEHGFAPGVPGKYFAMEATADVDLPAGELRVELDSDDGIEFFVDDRTVFSARQPGGHHGRETVRVTAGKHSLRLRYSQVDRDARLVVWLRML